ncbi:MAG: ABC transporter substrate-binding protein, partial [Actinomycetota bacterium]
GGGGAGGGGAGGGGAGGGGGGGGNLPGVDRTGIKADEIIIGIHAPTSGAAPIEPKAFRDGSDTYWKYLESKGVRIHGKKVRVIFEDDKYKPSDAIIACKKMTSGANAAFLLIGAAGTDQIRACAEYAHRKGIPYFSAGVQESLVKNYSTYSALSMSYAQQMPLLLQYIKAQGTAEDRYTSGGVAAPDGKIKIAFVRPNTNNFDDAQAALQRAFGTMGSQYQLLIRTVNKEGTQSEAAQLAQNLRNEGIDIVSPITAPNFTVYLVGAAGGQQYKPRYMGVGVTNGVNQGIARECTNQEMHNAMFFSPWPGWADRNRAGVGDPEFDAGVRQDGGGNGQDPAQSVNTRNGGGDLLMAIWGIMKTIHKVLDAAGPNLTRQSLVQMMKTYQGKTNFFPDLAFTPGSRFGANGVHALIGRCDANGSSGEFIEDPAHPGLRKSF